MNKNINKNKKYNEYLLKIKINIQKDLQFFNIPNSSEMMAFFTWIQHK